MGRALRLAAAGLIALAITGCEPQVADPPESPEPAKTSALPANGAATETVPVAAAPPLSPAPSSDPDATVNLGATGEITRSNDIAACNQVWTDLMGHWVSMTGRPRSEIDDFMRRGLAACQAVQRRVAANEVQGSTPECARWADESVSALQRFTTDVDLTNGAQADTSTSLVQRVRDANSACSASIE